MEKNMRYIKIITDKIYTIYMCYKHIIYTFSLVNIINCDGMTKFIFYPKNIGSKRETIKHEMIEGDKGKERANGLSTW